MESVGVLFLKKGSLEACITTEAIATLEANTMLEAKCTLMDELKSLDDDERNLATSRATLLAQRNVDLKILEDA